MEKITFCPNGDGTEVEFYVLEQTTLGGVNYILVADSEEEDATALILKDLSAQGDEEALYEIVSDDAEFTAVAGVFENLLEDVELQAGGDSEE